MEVQDNKNEQPLRYYRNNLGKYNFVSINFVLF